MSTDDDWLKALTASCRDAPQKTAKAEPATKPALAAYAHRLRQGDSNLSRKEAKALAAKHDRERQQAHKRNNH